LTRPANKGGMNRPVRRAAAVLVAMSLLALVATDLWVAGVRMWWDRHSITGSIASSLLVVAFTGLIVDEVVADRQRRDRSASVAVQALIVYGQIRRTYAAITTTGASGSDPVDTTDELRTVATMLLTASTGLFDDPEARRFLEESERFTATMLRSVTRKTGDGPGDGARERLESGMSRLRETVAPLMARLSPEDRSVLEGSAESG
jgi:hypothetical protein